jgi:DNA gyrase/topoisomerase IV subunit A
MTSAGENADARERLEILEAIVAGLERRSELLEIVSSSRDTETAQTRVADLFGLNRVQTLAILDIQVRRFSETERLKITQERDHFRALLS